MRLRMAVIVCAAASLSAPAAAPVRAPLNGLPGLMLWVWERPDDLRSLDPDVGVAFLAQTVTIDAHGVRVDGRRQPLRVAEAARVVAVTRIESAPGWTPAADAGMIRAVAGLVANTASLPRVRAVQLDFDARASERGFYRALVREVRAAVEPGIGLSITALASWCAGDDWLAGLPIDEAVPMLFQMGPEHGPYRAIAQSRAAAAPACRGAVGVSLAEPLTTHRAGRRLYVFNPQP